MSVTRVIKVAAGVAQNKVNSLGVTGLSLPADRGSISRGGVDNNSPLGRKSFKEVAGLLLGVTEGPEKKWKENFKSLGKTHRITHFENGPG